MAAKDRFSALDTLALLREVRSMGRARFDKAHDLGTGRVVLTFRVQGEGRRDLLVVPGKYGCFLSGERETAGEPGPLAAEIRRCLGGAVLADVQQPGGERYLELEFSRVSEAQPWKLVIEFFHPGNIVLVQGDRIMAAAVSKVWAHRTVRAGATYVRPPSRVDPLRLKEGDVATTLSRSTTNLVTTLATRLSLGGALAEEILTRCGRSPSAPAAETPDAVAREVIDHCARILAEIESPPRGYLYREGPEGPLVDVEPFRSVHGAGVAGRREETYPKFSQAAALYFESQRPRVVTREDQERARLERLREKQEATILSLERAEVQLRETADALLTNFAEAERELSRSLAEDPEVEEVTIAVNGRSIALRPRLTLRQNAQTLYDQAKELRSKLEGAVLALAQTKAEIARKAPPTDAPSRSALGESVHPRRTKHFWFEKSPRWLVTSSGLVAVAGKDARTNDWVVKRNLRAGDLYFHADVHGAPSVVVRGAGTNLPPDEQLREVGQWAASYSKAWRAEHASADTFWVQSDQVAKAGASGEFVPAGAWVIHGTKHYLRDLPLELGLGTITWEGESLVMVGPPACFAGAGRKLVWRISPGPEAKRREAERELARSMGISLEHVQGLLPGGGLRIQRA